MPLLLHCKGKSLESSTRSRSIVRLLVEWPASWSWRCNSTVVNPGPLGGSSLSNYHLRVSVLRLVVDRTAGILVWTCLMGIMLNTGIPGNRVKGVHLQRRG